MSWVSVGPGGLVTNYCITCPHVSWLGESVFSLNWLHWADPVIRVAMSVCGDVCAIECSFFSRPLVGPQVK